MYDKIILRLLLKIFVALIFVFACIEECFGSSMNFAYMFFMFHKPYYAYVILRITLVTSFSFYHRRFYLNGRYTNNFLHNTNKLFG